MLVRYLTPLTRCLPSAGAAGLLLGLTLVPSAHARASLPNASRLAATVLLRPSDLGAGWSSARDPSSVTGPICLTPGGRGTPAPVGEAMSWDFSQGSSGPFAQQFALTYANTKAATSVWSRLTRGRLVRCARANLTSESVGGSQFKIARSEEHTITVSGIRTYGHEFVATTSASGQSSTLYLDLLLLEHGRVLTALSVSSLGTPPLPSTEFHLEQAIARRLRRIRP